MQVLVGCSFTFFKYLLHPKSVLVRRRKQKQWQTSSEPIRTKRLVGPLFLTKNIGDFFFLKWYDMAKKWSDHGINKTTRNTVKESTSLQSTWKIQFHRLSSCNLFDHLISTPNVCWQPIRRNNSNEILRMGNFIWWKTLSLSKLDLPSSAHNGHHSFSLGGGNSSAFQGTSALHCLCLSVHSNSLKPLGQLEWHSFQLVLRCREA